jgi:hypothetical protein
MHMEETHMNRDHDMEESYKDSMADSRGRNGVHESPKHTTQGPYQDHTHEPPDVPIRASPRHPMHNISSDDEEDEHPQYRHVSVHHRKNSDRECVPAQMQQSDDDAVKVTQPCADERSMSAHRGRAESESESESVRGQHGDDNDEKCDAVKVKHATAAQETRKERKHARGEVDTHADEEHVDHGNTMTRHTKSDRGAYADEEHVDHGETVTKHMKSDRSEWRATGAEDECVGVRIVLELNYDRVSVVLCCVCVWVCSD